MLKFNEIVKMSILNESITECSIIKSTLSKDNSEIIVDNLFKNSIQTYFKDRIYDNRRYSEISSFWKNIHIDTSTTYKEGNNNEVNDKKIMYIEDMTFKEFTELDILKEINGKLVICRNTKYKDYDIRSRLY